VPYGFRYHLGFLNWLSWTERDVDYLSQLELERVGSAEALARAYDLIVFAGHHEYVTEREFDLIEDYRDLGGNLMFLSANNFFWRVERDGNVIVKASRWRDLGRPEARLVGVQYVGYQREPRAGWVVAAGSCPHVALRGNGPAPGIAVLARRCRDRPGLVGLARGCAARRRDPEPLRPGTVRPDVVLRDP